TIAPPTNLQHQSPLLSLPGEIKNIIYSYTLSDPERPFVDVIPGVSREADADESLPNVGVQLLQTCRRAYHEINPRVLFTHNYFRFTSLSSTKKFFEALEHEQRPLVRDVEIDVRKLSSNDYSSVAHEWVQFLAEKMGAWVGAARALRDDAWKLKCLRLNFTAWPVIPVRRADMWELLGAFLWSFKRKGLELERVVVIGASRGAGMAKRDPWSPAHFVGGDDVGTKYIIPQMWKAVCPAEDPQKVIRWERKDGRLYLEVVSIRYLKSHVDETWTGPCSNKTRTDPWPENGS
ncbi:hypothetical protein DM02DRAFT_486555, partial [Periconia macrospinosa]